jgi:tetratricopeptide (TPR) repeat protein
MGLPSLVVRSPLVLRRLADLLLVLLFGLLVFLMNCNELYDADIWWHLRSGEWILEHGRPPQVDPFTFGSEGRPWIDVHWLFQLLLLFVFRLGGTSAAILLAASVISLAVLVTLAARPRGSSLPMMLLCWIPALILINFRSQPRPEIFTLLFLAAYFAILTRAEDRPGLIWLLPVVQLLWVNVQGLFALGPVVLGMWVFVRSSSLLWQRFRGQIVESARPRRWWFYVLGSSLLVVLACLANPYGVKGALFPLELYPKVTQEGNPYKDIIGECFSARKVASLAPPETVANDGFFCVLHFLLLLLPLSFVVPALWEAARLSSLRSSETRPDSSSTLFLSSRTWLAILAVLVALLAIRVMTQTSAGRPPWLLGVGKFVPVVYVLAGVFGACLLTPRSRSAATLALVAGIGMAAWIAWLHDHLLFNRNIGDIGDPLPGSPSLVLSVLAFLCAAIATVFVVRFGGEPFGLLTAAAFGYLALSAVQNWGRWGLVAGILVSLNLGAWVARLLPSATDARPGWGSRLGRLGTAIVLLGGITAVLTGRYGGWVDRGFGLGEKPLVFPHDAVRFAAQPDMPDRALLYPAEAASLYVYYHVPGHKPFVDPRLEMPLLETVQTYLSISNFLSNRDPRGADSIDALGARVVVLAHKKHANAESVLLAHSNWRLVYFDAMAAVFLRRTDPQLEARFPTLNLGVRHFWEPHARPVPDTLGASFREAGALYSLGLALPKSTTAKEDQRLSVLLAALGRAEVAVEEEPARDAAWLLLGSCLQALIPERPGASARAVEGWVPETGLALARATYCLRRGLEAEPDDAQILRALYHSYSARGMLDAQLTIGERILTSKKVTTAEAAELRSLAREFHTLRSPQPPSTNTVPEVLIQLLESHQPEMAARLAAESVAADGAGWNWDLADRVAAACLHLGEAALALQLWQRATAPPSEAVRQSRLADAYWVERDFEAAIFHYQEARQLDPRLVEPRWALAWLYAELGQAGPALAVCREGLALRLEPESRSELESLERLLQTTVPPARHDAEVHPGEAVPAGRG